MTSGLENPSNGVVGRANRDEHFVPVAPRDPIQKLLTMTKVILSINAGSSSVKVSAYGIDETGSPPRQLVEAQVAGLTAPPSTFSSQSRSRSVKNQQLEDGISTQDAAFEYILDQLVADGDDGDDAPEIQRREIQRREDIVVACHRVVHGGDYEHARVITPETYENLEALTDLAPL